MRILPCSILVSVLLISGCGSAYVAEDGTLHYSTRASVCSETVFLCGQYSESFSTDTGCGCTSPDSTREDLQDVVPLVSLVRQYIATQIFTPTIDERLFFDFIRLDFTEHEVGEFYYDIWLVATAYTLDADNAPQQVSELSSPYRIHLRELPGIGAYAAYGSELLPSDMSDTRALEAAYEPDTVAWLLDTSTSTARIEGALQDVLDEARAEMDALAALARESATADEAAH